jgi:hypothetical protein
VQVSFKRGGVVFTALALIFVLSTSAQEPQKHEQQESPQPIWTGAQLQELLKKAEAIKDLQPDSFQPVRTSDLLKQRGGGYPQSPKIPDSYFDGAQWERVNFPAFGLLGGLGGFGGGLGGGSSGVVGFGGGFDGGFGGGFGGGLREWQGFGGGGSSSVRDLRPTWPADLSPSPSNPKTPGSKN